MRAVLDVNVPNYAAVMVTVAEAVDAIHAVQQQPRRGGLSWCIRRVSTSAQSRT
jgi:hypothetical protein